MEISSQLSLFNEQGEQNDLFHSSNDCLSWCIPLSKTDPKIVTVRSTKNFNNNTLIKGLHELPFELIRASADNPLVKLEIFLS